LLSNASLYDSGIHITEKASKIWFWLY